MNWLESFGRQGAAVQDLSRIRRLLTSIGNPQDALRIVHIAGTNGKGSVTAYLDCALRAAGYHTGAFVSPYVVHFQDRICAGGKEISQEAFARCCTQVKECAPQLPFSQFELTLASALLWYRQQHCDPVLLEAGMGGALDATNVIDRPLCSVITSISMDHMSVLGSTLEEIAGQKAGILKAGSPAVLSPDQEASAAAIVTEHAKTLGVSLRRPAAPQIVDCGLDGSAFWYEGTCYRISMGGAHQIMNALTALSAMDCLEEAGLHIPEEARRTGLQQAAISARMTRLCRQPLVYLDGAHNIGGTTALAAAVRTLSRPPVFLVGMLRTKDWETAIQPLLPLASAVVCVDDFAPNCVPAATLAEKWRCETACMSLAAGYQSVIELAKQRDCAAFVWGSLYLAAAILNQKAH